MTCVSHDQLCFVAPPSTPFFSWSIFLKSIFDSLLENKLEADGQSYALNGDSTEFF